MIGPMAKKYVLAVERYEPPDIFGSHVERSDNKNKNKWQLTAKGMPPTADEHAKLKT